MGQKQVDGPIGALRLRQWMRFAGIREFYVGQHPHGHYKSGELYIEIIVEDKRRREVEEAVLINLRKAGLYTGEMQFIPCAKCCVLRYGIRVGANTRIALFGRHILHKVSE